MEKNCEKFFLLISTNYKSNMKEVKECDRYEIFKVKELNYNSNKG